MIHQETTKQEHQFAKQINGNHWPTEFQDQRNQSKILKRYD